MERKYSQIFVVFGCAFIAFLPRTQAVSPTPDGCYPNFTTAEGCDALNSLTTGSGNTALGWRALYVDSSGSFNTGVGGGALTLNNGDSNTAVGAAALLLNTNGTQNTAVGTDAMVNNNANSNTAVGASALLLNVFGTQNTAVGTDAMAGNETGNNNTAVGAFALFELTTGIENSAFGASALYEHQTGDFNNALGGFALQLNASGSSNNAFGSYALGTNLSGSNNTAVGDSALFFSVGDYNIALGSGAGSNVATADGVIAIGHPGADVSNTTWIGNVYGVTTQSGITAPVVVSGSGQLGTVASSERFKKDIAGMDKSSEAIMSLRPVTFHYKTDSKDTPQFGLIAEEVAKVSPALVLSDKEGKPYSVRYEAVNAMLLNEFLKEHKAFVEEQHKVEKLQATVANLLTIVKEQTVQMQKVSRELAMNKAASQVAANDQ